ncbi:hypothetical protein PoB_006790000 [Plakobranchus ocellatus]|uniref:Small EDRK-rich factor-like N-terminal domain-containing protein n=1 Tax=Plakobranchus ocellatus TaxID=259542 RepID=A0AAV4DBC4_9GAST|nr:hypothetical protein PoB_006790000 [Plakobranchus ocellatus]
MSISIDKEFTLSLLFIWSASRSRPNAQSTTSLDSTVFFGVTVAVGEKSTGSSGSHLFSQAAGCALTSAIICLGQKRDKTRIMKTEAAHEAPAKMRRALRKQAQQRAQQDAIRAEGGPSYVPGGF